MRQRVVAPETKKTVNGINVDSADNVVWKQRKESAFISMAKPPRAAHLENPIHVKTVPRMDMNEFEQRYGTT